MDLFTSNPLKAQLLPSWDQQAVDLLWRPSGDPSVVGYNVWRAQSAPSNFGKITPTPLQVTFFRDTTKIVVVTETPTAWVSPPDSATGIVAIRAQRMPLVRDLLDERNRPVLASITDVRVVHTAFPSVGLQLEKVEPQTGLIVFGSRFVLGDKFDQWVKVEAPTSLADLSVSYFSVDRFTDSTFGKDLYYKITEVFSDGSEGPLANYPTISNLDLDPADMFWREAMRRNRFIFEQVGEPAHILLRRTTGRLCSCVDPDTIKPRANCTACWGVGYEGGYDGPYPFTFTPPNYVGKIVQGPEGRYKTRSGQSFIGPTPTVNSGDIIVRFNGERMVVLDVERTSVRGTTLQQTYTAELIRNADFRNRINIVNDNYPTIIISSSQPVLINSSNPFEDPIPPTISLQEGVSSVMISDPAQDTTKSENLIPEEDLRTNTQPSVSPVFENWSF